MARVTLAISHNRSVDVAGDLDRRSSSRGSRSPSRDRLRI
jgi:hypothetical protein